MITQMAAAAALALALVAAAYALQVDASSEHGHHEKSGEVTLEGEVLDMFCFMRHPESGQGPEHARCAKSCMEKGLPIGFLTSAGAVYLVLGADHEPATAMVADYAGRKSLLTGIVYEHHGVKSIEVVSIKAAE